jgi:hypothetical protein
MSAKCVHFLLNFTSNLEDPTTEGPRYVRMMQEVANRERTSIPISLDDVQIVSSLSFFFVLLTYNSSYT